MARGGAWFVESRYLRAAVRVGVTSEFRGDVDGFRLGRTLGP
jgi:formylglycine-generating enzyme required for sulfatase activity